MSLRAIESTDSANDPSQNGAVHYDIFVEHRPRSKKRAVAVESEVTRWIVAVVAFRAPIF